MRIRHTYLAVMLAAASAAVASTLAAAPPAAADCVEGGGITICSQGDARVVRTPYVPSSCDLDWMCDDLGNSVTETG